MAAWVLRRPKKLFMVWTPPSMQIEPDTSSGNHLSEQGKMLNRRFVEFLLKTKTDAFHAVDNKFNQLQLGRHYCSGVPQGHVEIRIT
jgi:hypothetical protein